MIKYTLVILLCLCPWIHAGLLPDYDKNCDHMNIKPCPVLEVINYRLSGSRKVPRSIHRIWFGDQARLSKPNRKSWEDYASQFGYSYRLWTENDQNEFSKFMSPKNYEIWKICIANKDWWAASDILRLEIIKEYGGIYLDCDFMVPHLDGSPIDLFSFIADDDLTLMLEHHGRNIGSNSAIFCANGLFCAPQGHALINYCVEHINENAMSWMNRTSTLSAMYMTGPFFLNRALNGTYRVIPVSFLHSLKMTD